ncbi:hypothetical protein [Gemmatimonas phototrophica]|uniref:PEGA domain-containing protein n=1 Tax=Gemmatimonas phototrophica TaxID=1379270 RepID=A0A143BGW7_9BACT|nr:hypothetical protein [Gemmatimonas phototrophica]AMW03742.1 hypothetical protein GEMMAAP_00535 [Gemmatimonas phototrophica]
MPSRRSLSLPGVLIGALAGASTLGAQTLELTASPAAATIYRLKELDRSLERIGVGAAKLKLEKNESNTVVVRLEGFKEVRRSFPKGPDYKDKRITLFLNRRVVEVSALPFDATIYINGTATGQRQADVEVEEGSSATVELRKPGFATVRRVYQWDKGSTQYPVSTDKLELVDRRVAVTAALPGAEVFTGDTKLGDGVADVVVPNGGCTTIRVQKAGWTPTERQYCNKEGFPPPPMGDQVPLSGRVVAVNAPQGARVFVNNRQAGTGAVSVKIPEGGCVTVRVEQSGFMPWQEPYCVQDNAPAPPLEANVQLAADESYGASVASDQANVNITVEVSSKLAEEQAWKLVSSIVLSAFDVLENSDSQTGYLRTAWQVRTWKETGRVVRTRVIVKRQGDSPLRYAIKIDSEQNRDPLKSARDDENFEAWDRLLNSYKDLISEMQARLK